MMAAEGQVAIEYRCKCGTSRLIRADVAREVALCFTCRKWAQRTGRRAVLGAHGALPADWEPIA